MHIFNKIILFALIALAVSSGITKVMLMQQDVAFFGQYGFSNWMLMSLGAVQAIGGVLLAFPRTRVMGAALVALTFLVSAVVLVMAGNLLVALITLVCVGLLGYIVKSTVKIPAR